MSTVQNGRQVDLSTQVERVKRKTRPWKSIIALLLAIAAAVISHQARRGTFTTNDLANQFISYGTAVAFLVFGSSAVFGLAGKSRELLEPTAGQAHSAIVRYALLLVGAFTTLVITLVLFGVDVSQLVLGGAITTVFLSIAAPQALGNVFAGLVLVFARPLHVGDAARLQAGAQRYGRSHPDRGGGRRGGRGRQVGHAGRPGAAAAAPGRAGIAAPEQNEGPAGKPAGPSSRKPVRRSPLGERRNAAPAERYSAKAVGAARGHSRTGR